MIKANEKFKVRNVLNASAHRLDEGTSSRSKWVMSLAKDGKKLQLCTQSRLASALVEMLAVARAALTAARSCCNLCVYCVHVRDIAEHLRIDLPVDDSLEGVYGLPNCMLPISAGFHLHFSQFVFGF